MTVFECKGCNFTTLLRGNYTRHLATEKHKSKEKPVQEATEIVTEVEEENNDVIKCDYCDKTFAYTQSMKRHMKDRCKKRDDVEILKKQLEEAKQELKKKDKNHKQDLLYEKKIYEKKIKKLNPANTTINNTTINNTNTVNIQNNYILPYKDTDTSHLTKKDYAFCIKPDGVRHLIEKIHFNPMKPENQNLTITNLTDKYMMVYDGSQWKKVLKCELNKIYNHKESLLEEWVEQDPALKEKFYEFIKTERKDVHLERIEAIKLMMYNQKPVAIV